MAAGFVAVVLADAFNAGALAVEDFATGFAGAFFVAGATAATAAFAVFVTFSATVLTVLFADEAAVLVAALANVELQVLGSGTSWGGPESNMLARYLSLRY